MRLGITFLTLAIFSIVGCSKQVKPELKGCNQQMTPAATVEFFLEHLHAGRPADAFRMCAVNEKMPKAFLEDEQEDLRKLSEELTAGTWHISFVEVHVEGPGAVGVVNEDIKNGKPSIDYDPIYLVCLEGKWWIVPGVYNYRAASVLLPEKEYAVFDRLKKWFKKRKRELKKEG